MKSGAAIFTCVESCTRVDFSLACLAPVLPVANGVKMSVASVLDLVWQSGAVISQIDAERIFRINIVFI